MRISSVVKALRPAASAWYLLSGLEEKAPFINMWKLATCDDNDNKRLALWTDEAQRQKIRPTLMDWLKHLPLDLLIEWSSVRNFLLGISIYHLHLHLTRHWPWLDPLIFWLFLSRRHHHRISHGAVWGRKQTHRHEMNELDGARVLSCLRPRLDLPEQDDQYLRAQNGETCRHQGGWQVSNQSSSVWPGSIRVYPSCTYREWLGTASVPEGNRLKMTSWT